MSRTLLARIASPITVHDVRRAPLPCLPAVHSAVVNVTWLLFYRAGEQRTMDLAEARATLQALQIISANFEAAIERSCGVHPSSDLTERNSS